MKNFQAVISAKRGKFVKKESLEHCQVLLIFSLMLHKKVAIYVELDSDKNLLDLFTKFFGVIEQVEISKHLQCYRHCHATGSLSNGFYAADFIYINNHQVLGGIVTLLC